MKIVTKYADEIAIRAQISDDIQDSQSVDPGKVQGIDLTLPKIHW
jgi:hypothetical protein